MNLAELKGLIQGELLTDEASLKARSADFGRMIERIPAAVVRPASTDDVATVIRFANTHGIKISTRGEAHTQTGQALTTGIVLDMGSLNRVLSHDADGLTVTAQAGVIWRDLVNYLKPHGFCPLVLTNNLGVTVGGTLSVAGLGVASFRYGSQADNVLELEIVTGTGEVVVCSPTRDTEIFDLARAGLGQFGVITRATLKMRRYKPLVRRYFMLYDDIDTFMTDAKQVMQDGRCDYIESFCVPAPMGFRTVGDEKQTFAEWFFPMHLSIEFDPAAPPDDAKALAGLKYYRFSHQEDQPLHDFFERMDPLFVLWKLGGYWTNPHPWMESVLPWGTAAEYIRNVLAVLPPASLGGGHVLLWPSSGRSSTVPLFMRPDSDWVIGFGILPGVPKERIQLAVERLNLASDFSEMAGGKRYLSGLIHFDHARWVAHFGDHWPEMNRMKKKYDPKHLLNAGFIPFDE